MTPSEIRKSYEQAANPQKQIRILADLNDCTVDEIKELLGINPVAETAKPKSAVIEVLEKQLEEVDRQIKALEEKYRNIVTAMSVIGEFGL